MKFVKILIQVIGMKSGLKKAKFRMLMGMVIGSGITMSIPSHIKSIWHDHIDLVA